MNLRPAYIRTETIEEEIRIGKEMFWGARIDSLSLSKWITLAGSNFRSYESRFFPQADRIAPLYDSSLLKNQ
jgi:hypothetical protein